MPAGGGGNQRERARRPAQPIAFASTVLQPGDEQGGIA